MRVGFLPGPGVAAGEMTANMPDAAAPFGWSVGAAVANDKAVFGGPASADANGAPGNPGDGLERVL
jgi:hypothetical protein